MLGARNLNSTQSRSIDYQLKFVIYEFCCCLRYICRFMKFLCTIMMSRYIHLQKTGYVCYMQAMHLSIS